LEIEKGDFIAIMGPSGSGKTTLLNILGMILTPDSGTYAFEGEDIKKNNDTVISKIRNKKIGFIFQNFNLIEDIDVYSNLEIPLKIAGVKKQKRKEIILKSLEQIGLSDKINHLPGQLSGGQQQRIAIARSIINDPELILADEPTGNLDSKTGNDIMEILKRINKETGSTIIMVTHDVKISEYADKKFFITDGEMKEYEK